MWFSKTKPQPFDLPIDAAFGLKVANRVVVAGVIAEGVIVKGAKAKLQVSGSSTPVTVVGLEAGPGKPVKSGSAGDRIAVMIEGAEKADVPEGARLISEGG